MHTTSLLAALAIGMFGLALLYLPGALVVRLVGMRGLPMVALAPAVTFGKSVV